ncbi:MAG: cyclic nucleotide-binding domain-containing protein [Nitrospiraceae bacterium]|nr:cyclic nucleotide-binding domain-containing protein [Nitrospiraceae bacterium]
MPKPDADPLDEIRAVPLFEGLAVPQLAALMNIAQVRTFARGQEIFGEGEPGAGFFVCVSGRAKVFKVAADGKEQILHVFGLHDPFGEAPTFEGGAYPANAAALEACRTLYFPRDAFMGLIECDPSLALRMLAMLSRRLRRLTKLIEELSLKEVPSRLATYLLHLSEQGEDPKIVQLPVTRGQLASLLGTIPETLSRVVARMALKGLIRSETPRTIRLLDFDGLSALASGDRRLS